MTTYQTRATETYTRMLNFIQTKLANVAQLTEMRFGADNEILCVMYVDNNGINQTACAVGKLVADAEKQMLFID